MIERKGDRIEISAGDMRCVVNNDNIAELLPLMHEMALEEIRRLRQVCVRAAADLLAVINRDDGQLRGAAAGDVDNVRLTLWLAANQAPKKGPLSLDLEESRIEPEPDRAVISGEMKTTPEMNAHIVGILRLSDRPTSQYAALRIEELEACSFRAWFSSTSPAHHHP